MLIHQQEIPRISNELLLVATEFIKYRFLLVKILSILIRIFHNTLRNIISKENKVSHSEVETKICSDHNKWNDCEAKLKDGR